MYWDPEVPEMDDPGVGEDEPVQAKVLFCADDKEFWVQDFLQVLVRCSEINVFEDV